VKGTICDLQDGKKRRVKRLRIVLFAYVRKGKSSVEPEFARAGSASGKLRRENYETKTVEVVSGASSKEGELSKSRREGGSEEQDPEWRLRAGLLPARTHRESP